MNARTPRDSTTTRWLPLLALLIAPVLLVTFALRPDTPAVAGQDPPARTPYWFPDLATGRLLATLSPVLDSFDNATRQGDWATLYTLMNEEIRRANTAAGFGAAMTQGNATSGPIVALRRGPVGSVQTNDDGVTFAIAAYALDRQTAAGVATKQYDVTFTLEHGSWKLWYMDEH